MIKNLRIIMDGRGIIGAVAATTVLHQLRGGTGTMQWKDLKARLLAVGQAHLTGEPAEKYIARSAAGPGAGGGGAVFFAMGSHRVKLALNPLSSIEIAHRGNGTADLFFEGQRISGHLLEPGFHCPDQAFITVTGSCIFSCKYCSVPRHRGKTKNHRGNHGDG